MVLALTLAALLAGIAFLHPYISYPLSLSMMWARPVRRVAAGDSIAPRPSATLLFSAYNEERALKPKLANLEAIKAFHPDLEILAYSDMSTDGTLALLESRPDLLRVIPTRERTGKAMGMRRMVAEAKGEICIFTDANVMLDVKSIPALARYYADPDVGCVCGHLVYTNGNEAASQTASNGSLYWRLEEHIKQLESETGSLMGADGSIFSIRRSLHHPPPADIIDDMYVSFSILCDGYRIVRAPDVIAYEESVTVAREEFRRKVRIACQAFNVHRLMWPRLRQLDAFNLYKYVSHKLLRWFVLLWVALSAASFCLFLFSVGFGWLAVALILAIAVGVLAGDRLKLGPVPQLVDIFYAFAATALGVWRSVKGDRFQTWTPAQSIRKQQ